MTDETAETDKTAPDTDADEVAVLDEPAIEDGGAADTNEASEPDAENNFDEDEARDEGAEVEFDSVLPLTSVIEALLFAARGPLKPKQLAKGVGKGTRQDLVLEAIAQLNTQYEESRRAFEIVEVAGTYQLMSRPEYAPHLRLLFGVKEQDKERKLSAAALDTLSIIAYKQPLTRAEVETIRGVGCGPILRQLIERGTVKVIGKRVDVMGQPLLYGTTQAFLQEFGLGSLDELPMIHEMRQHTGTTGALPTGDDGQTALPFEGEEGEAADEEVGADDEAFELDEDIEHADDEEGECEDDGDLADEDEDE